MIDSFKYPGKLFQNLEQFARVFKIAATDSEAYLKHASKLSNVQPPPVSQL